MPGHAVDRVGRITFRTRNPSIVEEDHTTVLGQAVCHKTIPVVETAPEVLQAHQRQLVSGTEPTISVADTVCFNVLGRSSVVCGGHGITFRLVLTELGRITRKAARRYRAPPRADQRKDRNAARISSVKIAGCSHAAKWPPLSSLL